jgi:hypothetical protein
VGDRQRLRHRAHPNEIGIRASMPAPPRTRELRFRVQYRDLRRPLALRARRRLGLASSRGRARESGWSFEVAGEGRDPARRGRLPLDAQRRKSCAARAA